MATAAVRQAGEDRALSICRVLSASFPSFRTGKNAKIPAEAAQSASPTLWPQHRLAMRPSPCFPVCTENLTERNSCEARQEWPSLMLPDLRWLVQKINEGAMAHPTFPMPMMPNFIGWSIARLRVSRPRYGAIAFTSAPLKYGLIHRLQFSFHAVPIEVQFGDLNLHLVIVDCVIHARINSLGHIGAQVPGTPEWTHGRTKLECGFIDVAPTDEDRRFLRRTRRNLRGASFGTNQARAQPYDRTITSRVFRAANSKARQPPLGGNPKSTVRSMGCLPGLHCPKDIRRWR